MFRYVLFRIVYSIIIIWGVLTTIFLILHFAPGDPASFYLSPDIKPQVVENIRNQMGFNLPLWQQYINWIYQFFTGNFGFSLLHSSPVNELIVNALINTLYLTSFVYLFQMIFGVILGIYIAAKQKLEKIKIIKILSLMLYVIPGFWLALILLMFFSFKLGWFPSGQMFSLSGSNSFSEFLADRLMHLVLPVLVLSIPFIVYTSRLVSENLIHILKQPFILMHKAYGLPEKKIFFKYALKNALLPVITLFGLYLPFLFGGAVVIEVIFSWPGMGRLTVNAILMHDYPLIMASMFIAAVSVTFGNLLADILNSIVDPRIDLTKKSVIRS